MKHSDDTEVIFHYLFFACITGERNGQQRAVRSW